MKRFVLLISILCSLLNESNGQGKITYADPSKEKWLPHQAIRTIYQDETGTIWVGTNGGVYKYNLFTAVNYNLTKKATNRFLNNSVRCINGDNNGNILIGTESGLGIMNPVDGSVQVVTKDDETVSKIIVSKKGVIWYYTNSGKIYKLLTAPGRLYTPELQFNGFVNRAAIQSIAVSVNENLLIGTSTGLFVFENATRKMLPLSFTHAVTALYAAGDAVVWVGTSEKGIHSIKLNSTESAVSSVQAYKTSGEEVVTGSFITAIRSYKDNAVLYSTPSGIFILENKISRLINRNLLFKESPVTDLLVDKTNNIWVGSRQGVFKIRRQFLEANYINLLPDKYLPDNYLNDIVSVGANQFWLLNSKSGVRRFNSETKKQEIVKLPFSTYILARKASNGDMLIIADDEVILIQSASLNSVSPAYKVIAKGQEWIDVSDIAEVAPGEWWATSWDKGLLRLSINGSSKTEAQYHLLQKQFPSKSHLFSILKDVRNDVWVGSRGDGVAKVNLETGQTGRYNKKNNASDRIIKIAEDSKGRVWVGTRGDGLYLYQPASDNFKVFEEKDGLPSNTVCAITENSNGEIWVSTLNGVASMLETQFIPFHSFGEEDGIVNSEFNFKVAAADAKGSVYFGNGAGMYEIKKQLAGNKQVMPVVWTSFDLLKNGKPETKPAVAGDIKSDYYQQLIQTKTVILTHAKNSFSIGFAALDFTTPEKNRYAYRLAGKDTGWTLVQGVRQQIQYVDLPPGNYTFEVKSANPLGEWAEQAQTISIVVKPAFWTTGYAFLIYGFLLLVAAIITFTLRKRWYKLNQMLEEEIESGKVHNRQMVFYTDLSHEIKNRLSLLLGPLEQALQGKKVNPQILNNLYEQGLRLKKLTDQIMDIRKSESGGFLMNVAEEDIKTLVKQIVHEAAPLAVVKNISISFKSLKENIKGWCDEEILEIVVMNLVSNAIKYCKANGTVEVKIDSQYLGETDLPQGLSKEGNYLCFTITDTGVGIAKNEIDKIIEPFYRAENVRYNKKETPGTGIGLNLVARLISRHHGSLEIRSELNEFTSITLFVPIDKGAYNITELKPHIVHTPIIMSAGKQEHQNEQVLILPEANSPQLPATANKEWNILIADDNEEVLKLLSDTLAEDFSVYKAENGKQALSVIQQKEINLIISDLDMPEMDGLTFCRTVRSNDKYKNIPFLLLTGRNSEEQKLVAFQNQVDDFIEKPFSADLLKWKVKSYLRNSAAKVKLKTVMVVEPKEEIKESAEDKFIQDIINLIEKHLDKDYLDVDFLAENMFSSRATFYRRMEQMVGESPSVFIRKYRLKKAALFLKTGNYTVAEVAYKTGFSNPKYFGKCFQKEFGVTPVRFVENETDA
ncbi:response regulator [Lacibacter sp.]|uniref:response regulator n=1 Tax=Lacibacter sp. TaxID=1915409 RepID=UPI002B4B60D4|nr:response regulator [Lacibacter sp.]HLP37714.1 response regulator [Lacibacter sp.]